MEAEPFTDYTTILYNQITTPKQTNNQDMVPCSILFSKRIQNATFENPLHLLFDSGSDETVLHIRCMPQGIKPSCTNKKMG